MTEILITFLAVFILFCIIFVFTHLRALTESEIKQLASKRRTQKIRMYYSFDKREYYPDRDLKNRMKAAGEFQQINEPLYQFPSFTAALLKYKKHEWIIIAFEKNNTVELIWLNKGPDKKHVPIFLPIDEIINIVKKKKYQTVISFHNHPNPNPNFENHTLPSVGDMSHANHFAEYLNEEGVNLLAFVCERGVHYEYYLSAAGSFYEISEFINEVNAVNDKSSIKNLWLHIERIF